MAPAARTAACLTSALLCIALLPAAAQATHTNAWQDGGAGAVIPASVDLAEVAAFGGSGVVIAVGQQEAPASDAKIYRRAAGTWVEDAISIPGAQDSDLVDVGLSQDAAWAVGTYTDAGGTHPLTLRVEGGVAALSAAAPATWSQAAETLADGATPTAVAVRGTDGLLAATVGGAGTIYPIHDAGSGSIDDSVSPQAPALAGAVNAIALFADGKAFTAGELQPGGGSNRIYKVDLSAPAGARMLPVFSGASGPNLLPMAGIGAHSESDGDAIAVEANPPGNVEPGTWNPTGSVWMRDDTSPAFTPDSKPSDLSARKPAATLEQAVAGTYGGAGAVWRRTGAGGWSRATPTSGGEPLNGVALIAANDIWAAGDDGEMVHYAPKPDADPPNTFIDSGPPAITSDPMATFTFSSDVASPTFECSLDGGAFVDCTTPPVRTIGPLSLGPHTFQVKASGATGTDLTPATRTVNIVAPDTFLDGPSGTTSDSTPTFTFFSEYGGASFQCSVDGQAFVPCSSPITLAALSEGDHIFQVRAVSSAGADPSPAARSFKVDLPDAPCKAVPNPLVSNVTVRKRKRNRKRMLLIEFDLAAPARVKAKAYHRAKLIGKTKERVLKQGHHRLKLRYKRKKGKPTNLKMLARPAANGACTRTYASNFD